MTTDGHTDDRKPEQFFPSARYDWEIDDMNGLRTTIQNAARQAREAGKAEEFRAFILSWLE
jgi:hypothetical protein